MVTLSSEITVFTDVPVGDFALLRYSSVTNLVNNDQCRVPARLESVVFLSVRPGGSDGYGVAIPWILSGFCNSQRPGSQQSSHGTNRMKNQNEKWLICKYGLIVAALATPLRVGKWVW